MNAPVVIAIDQGTTNTKAVAVGAHGSVLARRQRRVGISFPRPGWAESDPEELFRSVAAVATEVIEHVSPERVAAVAITNQRETVVAWDPTTGTALAPAISWQCTRGASLCDGLSTSANRNLVSAITGLQLSPMFSASKIRWLLDHVVDAQQRADDGRLVVGTVDTWLLWNLTGGASFATDVTNASRTSLCDLATGTWHPELLDLFGVPPAVLAPIHLSADQFGTCRLPALRGRSVPITALIGDSHAALVGHGAFAPGAVKASFGTGTSVLAPVSDPHARPNGLSTTIGWSAHTGSSSRIVHAVEGNIYATGAALEWAAQLMAVEVDELEALAARAGTGSPAVGLIPAFSGLGAPHWNPHAVGGLFGVTRGVGRAEVARAAFDAVGHQVADVLDAALGTIGRIADLRVDGGAMRSDLLAHTVADLTGTPLIRSDDPDVAAIGAAQLAGLGVALWSGTDDLAGLHRSTSTIHPTMSDAIRRERREQWAEWLDLSIPSAGR